MNLPGPAPVALFAFNRPETTRSTLQALKNCDGLGDRSVYLFCDGPRTNRSDDELAVFQVRRVLHDWAAGQRAQCLFSDSNCGLRASIVRGVGEILREHGRVIVLEDDLIVAPGFLRFMQQSLDAFEHTPRVWQVSGYMTPNRRRSLQPGFLRLPCCWGWATWQDRWQNFHDNASELLAKVRELDTVRFNLGGTYDYLGDLQANAEGRLNTWHVRWYATMFLQQALAYYPGQSLTRNIGFDAAGTHCSSTRMASVYHLQVLGNCPPPPPVGIVIDESEDLLLEMQSFYRFQQRLWSGVTWRQRLRAKIGGVWRRLRRCLP